MQFDIMLPYYGDVALMQAAVRSVLNQNYPHFRLTVVDDGQAPGVPEWFASLGDDRVRYQRNEQNLGVTRNYKKCLGLVEFPYFVMMGTDDIMLPNYLDTVRAAIEAYPNVAIVQPGVAVIDEHSKVVHTLADEVKRRLYAPKIKDLELLGGENLAASLLAGCWFYFPSLCWRSDAVKAVGFREGLEVIQDLALVIDLIQRGEEMAVSSEVCFHYRRHTTSVSAAGAIAGTRFDEARGYFIEVARQMDEHGWPRAARAARRYLSSRLHALTLLPTAFKARHKTGIRNLARHAFGPARHAK